MIEADASPAPAPRAAPRRLAARAALGCATALLVPWAGLKVARARQSADALGSLAAEPGPAATARLRRMLGRSRDPDQRLWLVDALYARVAARRDEAALEALVRATGDADPNVRRRAVSSLEAFRFLPEARVRAAWLAPLADAARRSAEDPAPPVRAAAAELRRSIDRWAGGGGGKGAEAEAARSREEPADAEAGGPAGQPPGGRRRWLGLLVWAVLFQFAGYLWQRLGINLFTTAGAAGAEVRAGWEAFKARPALFAYPALASAVTILGLGASFARLLVGAVMPQDGGLRAGAALSVGAAAYLFGTLACFVPAAMLAAELADDPEGRRGLVGRAGAAARRSPGLLLLGLLFTGLWPWEILRRAAGLRRGSWLEREGTPLAALLGAVVMARERLGAWAAMPRASERYDAGTEDPATALLGRPCFQPQFLSLCLSAPLLFGLSAALSMWAVDFSPPRMFGLWFLSAGTFAVGFGLWAGALMSASMLALLFSFGAVHATRRRPRDG